MRRYYAIRFVAWVIAHLPRRLAYVVAALLGEVCFAVSGATRRVTVRQMRHVLGPTAAPARVRAAARGCLRAAAWYYADLVRTPSLDLVQFNQTRIRDYGYGYVTQAREAGRGVILATLHYGNPELAAQCLVARGVRFTALVERLEPPALAKFFHDLRSSHGNEFVEVSLSGIKHVIRRLRAGGVVAILIDRDLENRGVGVPFFGATACIPPGAVDLALLTGADLLPTVARRIGFDQFEVTIEAPLRLRRTGNRDTDRQVNTARLIRRFEPYLRAHPSQWFLLQESIWRAGSGERGAGSGGERGRCDKIET